MSFFGIHKAIASQPSSAIARTTTKLRLLLGIAVMSTLSVIERDGLLVVDSLLIAERLDIEHESFIRNLKKHKIRIESRFGVIRFEIGKPPTGSKGGRPQDYALLTEPQATVLMTLSKNTERVVECKLELVDAFEKAKQVIKQVIPAQSQEIERMKLELQLLQVKQHYLDTSYAIQLSTSSTTLDWLRGEAPSPVKVEYTERFIDSHSGKELGSTEGRSLTQLITDAGLNPKSARDRNRVKRILKGCGMDYDKMQCWSTASYLRKYPVLGDEVYDQALKAVLGEVTAGNSQPNLFVHHMQQAALNSKTSTPSSSNKEISHANNSVVIWK